MKRSQKKSLKLCIEIHVKLNKSCKHQMLKSLFSTRKQVTWLKWNSSFKQVQIRYVEIKITFFLNIYTDQSLSAPKLFHHMISLSKYSVSIAIRRDVTGEIWRWRWRTCEQPDPWWWHSNASSTDRENVAMIRSVITKPWPCGVRAGVLWPHMTLT